MTTHTQSERAGLAVEGAATAGQAGPVGASPHSLSTSFFAEGERKEQEGWDMSDLVQVVARRSAIYASFDHIPRQRWPWPWVAMVAVGVLGFAAVIWLG